MNQTFLILIAAAVVIGGYLLTLYNGLVRLATQIDEAWSQIDVQLKRRTDLIPNLIETVKGYAKHEKGVFEEVTKARSALMKADTPAKSAEASNMLTGALKSLFAVAEAYPDLKANENFMQLQKELSDTEDKIAYARQFYNSNIMTYNVKVKSFPNNMVVGMFGFMEREFFEIAESERQPVKVSFDDKKAASPKK